MAAENTKYVVVLNVVKNAYKVFLKFVSQCRPS